MSPAVFSPMCRQGDVQAIGHNDPCLADRVTPMVAHGQAGDHPVAPCAAPMTAFMPAWRTHCTARRGGRGC